MEFRLTYAGPLYATQRDPLEGKPPKHTQNRHDIRKAFHGQLKRLWGEIPALKNGQGGGPMLLSMGGDREYVPPLTDIESLAKRHAHYGFNFVPLVTAELDLICGLDILFLRPDRPGGVIWAGDIDNRIKTLLDAMRIPEAGEGYSARQPDSDEQPFFCLLEDDKLISKISVETDRLLQPINNEAADARLVITVRIRPYELHGDNMHYG
ncbi:hypothetical protein [Mesorhizobium sp. M1272]|uniref:hypothetical protein n=1 Tax=Mesorhizobium sp. M1272 TaxID=2957074 RepID=UPI00333C5894